MNINCFVYRKDIDNDLFGNARTRSEVFWERYDLLLQVKLNFLMKKNILFLFNKNLIENFKT